MASTARDPGRLARAVVASETWRAQRAGAPRVHLTDDAVVTLLTVLLLAPVTADVIADYLAEGQLPAVAAHFTIDRFGRAA